MGVIRTVHFSCEIEFKLRSLARDEIDINVLSMVC
jgi:hypothetical protein